MTAIRRRSVRNAVSAATTLALANELSGSLVRTLDVSGKVAIVVQEAVGTTGTGGVDVIEISHDGGITWTPDNTLLPLANSWFTGTLANEETADVPGSLNVAGADVILAGVFKGGPYTGPSLMRVARAVANSPLSILWGTAAPLVYAVAIG